MGSFQTQADKTSRQKLQLYPGQQVIAQHVLTRRWDQHATIIESRSNGRSYIVRIRGKEYLRNRRFLRPYPEPYQTSPVPTQAQQRNQTRPAPIQAQQRNFNVPSPNSRQINREIEEPLRQYPTQERHV